MRMLLVPILAVLAHAQPQAGTLPAPPATKRFFFMSGPRDFGRPVFEQPAQSPGTGGFLRPYALTYRIPRNPVRRTVTSPVRLLPLELPTQDFWKFIRPANTKRFFFFKP